MLDTAGATNQPRVRLDLGRRQLHMVRNTRTPMTVHLARTTQIGDRVLCGTTLGRRWELLPQSVGARLSMCLICEGAER